MHFLLNILKPPFVGLIIHW